jgi:hypothetical protein
MTRSKLVPALAATVALLTLGACGSGSDDPAESTGGSSGSTAPAGTDDPAPSSPDTPTKTVPTETPVAPAPTTKAPAGKLIDYETGDDSGATIATPADTGRLTGSPADFKSFISARLAAASPGEGCTEPPQIYVSRVDTGGWARGGYSIPQCGGYAALWAKSGGTWTEIWSGQSLVECSTLTKYKMPARVAGASCLDGDATVDYAG